MARKRRLFRRPKRRLTLKIVATAAVAAAALATPTEADLAARSASPSGGFSVQAGAG